MSDRVTLRIRVNGTELVIDLEPDRSLLHVLREELDLTGAKYGCGEGACGACTVLLDGRPVRSCTMRLADVGDRDVTTVEGLAAEGRLDVLGPAFLEEAAFQCGFCTPGMVVAASALLSETAHPSEPAVAAALDGNVCRCGAYARIVRAVRRAAAGADPTPVAADAASAAPAELSRPLAPWDLTPVERRDWFDVLPEGLVVVLDPGEEDPRSRATTRDAWMHVASDGTVTAFTGKVNVGQDNRTALRLVVARELGVPLGSVRLVMGDTDVCPFDMGTFGSRSMPDAAPALAAAAAGARTALAERTIVPGERRIEVVPIARVEPRSAPRMDAPVRRGSIETVTGARRYVSDRALPGMRHGVIARPPAFGSVASAVDASGAEAIGGVLVVGEDDLVGVVADDPATAARAASAIRAEWTAPPGPPSDETLVEHLRAHPAEVQGWGAGLREEVGDVDRALADAETRVDATYTAAYLAHVPLETRVALAEWEGGRLTVWTGTQRPFGVRSELAEALGVAEADVRVIVPDAGGGYGGKHSGEAAIEAARLARAAGAPVKVRWSREEEFTWAYFRPAAVIDVAAGVRGGVLTAWSFENLNAGPAGIEPPYRIPARRIRYQPAESPLRQGSYRALAATVNHFARESHVDDLARAVGADPVEFRLRHIADARLADVLRAVAERVGWGGAGALGIACGVEKDAYVATCAEVAVGADDRVRVTRIVSAVDAGAVVDREGLVNQIEGATVMALGGALTERIRFADGRIIDPCLSRYAVPRFTDVPPMDVVVIDRPDIPPAGAGETPIVAVAPAVANAIVAASGVRIRSMPLVPDGTIAR
jgi:nicotinate dehydrogenase subunit B